MKNKTIDWFSSCFSTKKIETENPPVVIKRWKIWKNLLVICLAWVLLFTAFQGNKISYSKKYIIFK
jgi:hypothetical protein